MKNYNQSDDRISKMRTTIYDTVFGMKNYFAVLLFKVSLTSLVENN